MKINKKRILVIFFCLIILVNLFVYPAYADTNNKFTDIVPSDYFYSSVINMYDKGLVNGYSDNTFRPTNYVTVGEALTLLSRVSKIDIYTSENPISWNSDILNRMLELNVISDITKDNLLATRLDISKYIIKIYKLNISTSSNSPFYDTNSSIANTMYAYKIFEGILDDKGRKFSGDSYITRADLCLVLNRLNLLIASPYIGTMLIDDIEINKNPFEMNDFIIILKHMMNNNYLNFKIPYSIKLSDMNNFVKLKENLKIAFNICFSKYPEYFSFTPILNIKREILSENNGYLVLSLANENFSSSEIIKMQTEFNNGCINIISELYLNSSLTDSLSDIEKVEVLFKYIALNLEYDTKYLNESYTGYGALKNKKAVCQGYSAMFNKLCTLVNLDVEGVSGQLKSTNVDHMWTKIKINGVWSYFDTTFSDPVPNQDGYCDMSYFNMVYNDIMKDRIVDEFLIY